MTARDAGIIAARLRLACEWEVRARKVGNVHPGRDFADTTADDFLRSAEAVEAAFREELQRTPTVGSLVLAGVRATRAKVSVNTNLGILLLLAPLALAPSPDEVGGVLGALTVEDARQVYEAIRLANPGGLGHAAEHDVADEPTVTLSAAMSLAADRDLVARQYQESFLTILEVGLPALTQGHANHCSAEAAVIHCHLQLMAREPDTLIARKLGPEAAHGVRDRARAALKLGGLGTPAGRSRARELDQYLRSDGNKLNPGATADLVAASIYCALCYNVMSPTDAFDWPVNDWLAP